MSFPRFVSAARSPSSRRFTWHPTSDLDDCTGVHYIGGVPGPRSGSNEGGFPNMAANDRAREILAFIRRFTREKGFPPTIREIGEAFRISSTNGVRYHLSRLEKSGELKR